MDSKNVIAMIEADGWYLVRIKGSHHQFKHPLKGAGNGKTYTKGHSVTHSKSIKRQSGI